MKHKSGKIKIRKGKDSNEVIVKNMVSNFLIHNKIETTLKRAKILSGIIDRLVNKAKTRTMANDNYLKKKIDSKELVKKLIEVIAPVFSDRNSGFLKLKRLGTRLGDASEMALLEWVKPITDSSKKSEKVENKENK